MMMLYREWCLGDNYEKNKDFYERKEFAFALMYVTVKNNAVLVTKFKGGE